MEQSLPLKKRFSSALKFIVPVIFAAFLLPGALFAQATLIAYTGPNRYMVGAPITPLTPSTENVFDLINYNRVETIASSNSGLSQPSCVAVANFLTTRYIYVVSNQTNVILRNSNGLSTVLTVAAPIYNMIGDGGTRLFFTESGGSSVWETDITIATGALSTPTPIVTGGNPSGLALDGSGNLYYADQVTGAITEIPAKQGASPVAIGNVSSPGALVADATDNLYVQNASTHVTTEFPAGGGSPVQVDFGVGNFIAGVGDGAGNLYLVGTNDGLVRILAGGGAPFEIGGYLEDSYPQYVAVDGTGVVYFTDGINLADVGPTGGFFINPALPLGLSLDAVFGTISGTPTVATSATNYTVTAWSEFGPGSDNVNIETDTPFNILSLIPAGRGPIIYTATFSSKVSGLTASNFSIASSGFPNARISGTPATSDGGKTWTVPVTAGAGNGTVQLSLANTTGASPTITTALPFAGVIDTVYNIAPAVSSITATTPSNVLPTNATSVTYTVTFTEPVKGVASGAFTATTGGSVTTTGVTVNAVSSSVYAVTVSGISGTGTLRLDLNSSGTGITNPSTVPISGGFTTGDVYNINPPVSSVSSATFTSNNSTNPAFARNGDVVNTSITYNNTQQSLLEAIGGHTVTAVNSSGNLWQANYTVTGSDPDGPMAYAAAATDPSGNLTEITSGTNNSYITIDNTPPTVSIGAPSVAYINSSATVSYTVTWSDANLNASSISLSATQLQFGGSGYAVNLGNVNISGSGNTRTISITGVSGDGTMFFSIPSGTASDNAGNSASASNTSASVTVDNTPPALTSLLYSSSNSNDAFAKTGDVITLSFGTNETIQTPSVTIAEHSITAVNTGGNNYTASYTMTSGDTEGRIPFNLVVTDLAGNAGTYTDVAAGDDITFDMTPPTVMIAAPSSSSVSGNGSSLVTYAVTYADANFNTSNLTTAGITVNATGSATATPIVTGSGTSYNVTLSNISGIGTLGITVGAGYSSDLAGNTDLGAGPSTPFNVLSSDATLSNLTASAVLLTPAFTPGQTSYTANVPNSIQSITITPTTDNANAAVMVNSIPVNSGTASGSIPLALGTNTITIAVTAQDGVTTDTYTVVITRAPNTNLGFLYLSKGTLSPAFATGTTSYTASVPYSVSSITATPTTQNALTTITVNGNTVSSGTASGSIPLNVGTNTISTVITGQDGATTTSYTVVVTRAEGLSSLALSNGGLSPGFNSSTTSYTASVGSGVSSLTVTPTTNDATATITVNNVAVSSGTASGSIPLNVGANTITTTVTPQSGTGAQTYTVTVTRAPSSNANLGYLGLSKGTLSPVFAAATSSYTASVPYSVSGITITPTTQNANSKVTVNGNSVTPGTASGNIPLSVGANTITTIVTAQDGTTTNTYTVIVTRAEGLSSLALSAGGLTPGFNSGTTTYSVSVGSGITAITVTPTTNDATATITVNTNTVSSGTASTSIPLNVGPNTITTTVTAQDGVAKQTYTLTVTRAPSSNANLGYLSLSHCILSPTFAPATTSYTANVANSISSITVTPTTQNASSTVMVNNVAVNDGAASGLIMLNVGANTITTIVTAQDGTTTNTYTVTVTRAPGAADVVDPISVTQPTETPQLADDGILVHRGVSPNGDGIEDFLQIDNISQYPDNHLVIMNRNGELVYDMKGYDNSARVFDGHNNKTGQMQLPGTYFFALDYTVQGIIKHKTGFLVLKY